MNERKRVVVNVGVSVATQIIILLLGLVVPRIMLVNYGSDTNGFTSTVTQIFAYMALLEAGIAQSARNLLYKPVKEHNENEISYYVSAARTNFRKIAKVYFSAVLICGILMPLLLKTSLSSYTITLYIIFEGLTGVVSFYYIQPWICLLTVDGKYYIISIVNAIMTILMYGVKIVLAVLGSNILFIQVLFFGVSLLRVLIYHLYMKKNYPWLQYHLAPKNFKLKDRNSFIITEIAWTIFSSTDMIVLSIFVSTAMSSVYSVYNMVFVAINGVVNAAYSAIKYRLGLDYAENREKYIRTHDIFNSLFIGGMTVLMCTTYVLIPYFIGIYTRGVNDINYIYFWLPLMFCLVQLFSWSRSIAGNLISISGRVRQSVWVSIVEALANISLSIILVQVFSITGVILATVLSLPLKIVYNNYVADVIILKRKPLKTIGIIMTNLFFFLLVVWISNSFIKFNITTYKLFVVYAIPTFAIVLVLGVIINIAMNKSILRVNHHIDRE